MQFLKRCSRFVRLRCQPRTRWEGLRDARWFSSNRDGTNPYCDPDRDRMLSVENSDYDSVYNSFVMPNPDYYNIGVDVSDKHVRLGRGDREALSFRMGGHRHSVTFGDLSSTSNQICNLLEDRCAVTTGDRVALLMSQSPETALAHISVYKSGAIAVPLFVLFNAEALEYRLNNSGAKVLIVEPSKLDAILDLINGNNLPKLKSVIIAPPMSALGEEPERVDVPSVINGVEMINLYSVIDQYSSEYDPVLTGLRDPALLVYTSGTTGPPKGALHAHRTLLGHLPGVEFPQSFFPQPEDKFWTPADWAWVGGLIDCLLPSLHHGVPVVAHRFKKFDSDEAFKLIQDEKIKNMFMPPTALKFMAQLDVDRVLKEYDLSVRSIGSGGEPLGEALLAWGRKVFGVRINEFYGQTECNLVLGNCEYAHKVVPGSMGRQIPGQTVRILHEDGHIVPSGQVGDIGIKMPHHVAFLEYWANREATQKKFITEPESGDRYLLTGDLGKVDEDGYYWFFGREDDVICSSGYRIGPAEIENCINHHPDVTNSAVVGKPDELRTEIVKAFIVLNPECERDHDEMRKDIQEFVKSKLAAYEYPREVEFVDSLPMTTTGKVIRSELKGR